MRAISQWAFVVCDDEVIATDAPPTFGVLVMRAIRDVTDKADYPCCFTWCSAVCDPADRGEMRDDRLGRHVISLPNSAFRLQ